MLHSPPVTSPSPVKHDTAAHAAPKYPDSRATNCWSRINSPCRSSRAVPSSIAPLASRAARS